MIMSNLLLQRTCLAGLLSMAALLQAAPGIPFIHNFTPPVFGTNAQNLAIVQDQRGLIYVGNEGVVLEYDGVHWRLIPTRNRTCVCSLALDTQGRVYVGAQGETG